jgi:hypothetical protein
MKTCTGCHGPIAIAESARPRVMWFDFLYAMIYECPRCGSTQALVIFELPDDVLAQDGDINGATDHLSDLREESAA